jgi:hypothetical protein
MSVTVIINDLTLAHKGSAGTANATLPDSCKTPSPGGPVPLPYPNIAISADLAKGTTTIRADGGNMCANKGSELSRSTGDEAGTAGGVTSSTFIKEATWMLYSDDVFFEGKNACRLTDKLFMNHQNTVCLGGWKQAFKQAKRKNKDLNECDFLHQWITEAIGEDTAESGEPGKLTGSPGLANKIHRNTFGGNLGAAGAPRYPAPTTIDPVTRQIKVGKNAWQTHDDQIREKQQNLADLIKEYDEMCAMPPPSVKRTKADERFIQNAREWTKPEKRPTAADWKGTPYP